MRLAFVGTFVVAFCMAASALTEGQAREHKPVFKGGKSSTGWIAFEFQDSKRIFIPVKINGHDTKVLLATGLPTSNIDKAFAASIGLQPQQNSNAAASGAGASAGLIRGLQIQIGNLTLEDTSASPVNFAPLAEHIGHALPFLLGDDAFNHLVVDIDFARQRIAFSDPGSETRPDGAVEVPLLKVDDTPVIPVSIEGASPAQFELGLGNSGEMLVYQSYYESHKLTAGRPVSKRLAAGTGGFVIETVATLKQAEFAGVRFESMPAAFIPASVAGTTSNVIAGDVGLPVLSRFRLIIDYSHGRLWAVPYPDAGRAAFAKDRLGLALNKKDTRFGVEFVAPDSPAEAAGFKTGDRITLIDGKPAQAWPETEFANLRYEASGTILTFTMEDGAARRVKLVDYF